MQIFLFPPGRPPTPSRKPPVRALPASRAPNPPFSLPIQAQVSAGTKMEDGVAGSIWSLRVFPTFPPPPNCPSHRPGPILAVSCSFRFLLQVRRCNTSTRRPAEGRGGGRGLLQPGARLLPGPASPTPSHPHPACPDPRLNCPLLSPHTPRRPTFYNPRRTGAGQGCGKSSLRCEKQVLARACGLKASRPVPHPSPREGLPLSAAKRRVSGRGRGGAGAAVSTPRQRTPEERSSGCVRSPAPPLRTPLWVPYLLLSLLLLLGVVPGPRSLRATRSRYQEASRVRRQSGACKQDEALAGYVGLVSQWKATPSPRPSCPSGSRRALGGAHTLSVAPQSSPPPPAAL